MSEVGSEVEEPVWRARARVAAMAFLVLGILLDLAGPAPGPAVLLGSIVAVVAVYLRLPFGVAVLFIDAALELVDVIVSYAEHGVLSALGHAAFALGLGAIALVLYRRSSDEAFERRGTIFVRLRMGVPSGAEGLNRLTNDGAIGENREVVEDGGRRWIHERYTTELGSEWSCCRVEIVHGVGARVCAVVYGDTTAEHMSELTDAIAAMRWGP